MKLPTDLVNIIEMYKNELERREVYLYDLATFANALECKPIVYTSVSTIEARQAFLRVFTGHRPYLLHIAKDLERFFGEPYRVGNNHLWILSPKFGNCIKKEDQPFMFYDDVDVSPESEENFFVE